MDNEFINNRNLNFSNSLTHLFNEILNFDEKEPNILTKSRYYNNNIFCNSYKIKNADVVLFSLNCQCFNSIKLDQLPIFCY